MQNLQEVKYTGTSQTAVIMPSINDTTLLLHLCQELCLGKRVCDLIFVQHNASHVTVWPFSSLSVCIIIKSEHWHNISIP